MTIARRAERLARDIADQVRRDLVNDCPAWKGELAVRNTEIKIAELLLPAFWDLFDEGRQHERDYEEDD